MATNGDAAPAAVDHRQLVESSPVAIVVQCQNRIVFANPSARQLLASAGSGDLVGRSLRDFVSAMDAPGAAQFHRLLETREAATAIEVELVPLNAPAFWAEISTVPMMYDQKPAVQVVLRDMAQEKRAAAELQQRNKELASLYAIAETVSLSADLDQILQDALTEVIRLEIVPGEMFGMLFLQDANGRRLRLAASCGAPPDHPCLTSPPEIGECLCGLAVAQGKTIVCYDAAADERHTRRWFGADTHQDICIPLKARGKVLGVMEFRLPHRRPVEQQELHLLQAVADQIGVAVENMSLMQRRQIDLNDERERIARQLHDEFSQLLGYVTTKAMAVRLLVKEGRLDAAYQNLHQLEEAARGLYVDVRQAIMELRYGGRQSSGLAPGLAELAAGFSQLTGLAVEVAVDDRLAALPLKRETEYHLLGIVQEALHNAHRHGQPSCTRVSAVISEECLELAIDDDGIGFDVNDEHSQQASHFGLQSIRKRAAEIGATVQIASGRGRGTHIEVQLPLDGI